MRRGATRIFGIFAAISLPLAVGAVGCGHTSFDFLSAEANMDSGSGGGYPPPQGSGGFPAASGGGMPVPPGTGGMSGGGEGGQGGESGCYGGSCPELPCCDDIDVFCTPFEPCIYCSQPEHCGPGYACDPFTNQCMPECDDDFDCPSHARLCDEARNVCIQCYDDVHCPRGRECEYGFCIACDDNCH